MSNNPAPDSRPKREISFAFRPSKAANRRTRASRTTYKGGIEPRWPATRKPALVTGNTALKLGLIREKKFAFLGQSWPTVPANARCASRLP